MFTSRHLITALCFSMIYGCSDTGNEGVQIENHSEVNKTIGKTVIIDPEQSTHNEVSELTSIRKEFYEDGKIKEEVNFKGDLKDGIRRKWYSNGNLSIEGTMEMDKWNGTYREWYSDGMPKLVGEYLDGKQHGEWFFYDKNGVKLPSLTYDNGKEVTRNLPKVFGE